jgi:beta-mannosidase
VVRVDSPQEEVGRVWSFNKRLIKGIFSHHDTRPGGAWSTRGQEQNTGGIWAPVYLRVSQMLAIDDVRVIPILHEGSQSAEAKVELSITYNSPHAREYVVEALLSPHNFTADVNTGGQWRQTFHFVPGINRLTLTVPCANPSLWWTWDHGYPHLYTLQVNAHDATTLFDSKATVFGFRQLVYEPASKQWSLNGHRIFLRGTNYIASQWLSEMTAEKYANDLTLMKQAHINAIRVHAHIEAGDFYRLSDEVGMLLWQDFPLQWGYSDEPAFINEATRQAQAMVSSLFNHPSIFTWCLHNEPPWDASWMQYKYPEYQPDHNKQLDAALVNNLQGIDPTRYVYPYSATREHPWLGWYSGSWLDYGKPTQEPLIAEYGAQALPEFTALTKIFGDNGVWPESKAQWEQWEYHNFQRHETFNIAQAPQGNNVHEWIAHSQEYQARLIKFAAEAYRRQRFSPVTGIFQFMLVENWPSVNWGILDYWRVPKAGYFALQTAYQPILPSIAYTKLHWNVNEPVSFDLWIVNDSWQSYPASTLRYVLWDETKIIEQESVTVHVDADSSEKILTLHKPQLPAQHYFLSVSLVSASGEVLGWNQHDFKTEAKPR